MLQDLEQIVAVGIGLDQIAVNLIIAFVCGALIALFYRFTYRGPSPSDSFVHSMILLSMITATVIMVIGSNLARAFGLVGAMSIIRFRTAVKDTQDIIFIFFSLCAGLAAGAGLHLIAFCGTIFIGLVAMFLARSRFGVVRRREFLLQFIMKETEGDEAPYLPILKRYCSRSKLVNIKSEEDSGPMELSFYVNLIQKNDDPALVQALRDLGCIERINLFFDEEHY